MFHDIALKISLAIGLEEGSNLFSATTFFIEDTTKIITLMFVMMVIMTFLRSYLPTEKIKKYVEKAPFGLSHFIASVLGAVTPFCSCSSLPLFFTFLKAGVPTGVTLAFLVTSPLINEVALIMLWGLFGFKFMIFWLVSGLALGTILGMVFEVLNLKRFITDDFKNPEKQKSDTKILFIDRIKFALRRGLSLTKNVTPFVLIGIFIGSIIHGFVPENFFTEKISMQNPLAVPISVIIAIPLYANASGVIPIIQSLVAKGVPLGTALAFMMATVGLSLPEAIILKKAMKWQLLAIFFASVGICIMIIGFLANIIF